MNACPNGEKDHLSERSGRRAQAQRQRAPFRADHLHHRGEGYGEGRERHADADQDPGRHLQPGRAVGVRHAPDAASVDHRARCQHAWGPEPVTQRTGERQGDAPEEILDRQRHRERLTPPPLRGGHRLEEQAEDRARAEPHHGERACHRDDHRRRPPARPVETMLRGVHGGRGHLPPPSEPLPSTEPKPRARGSSTGANGTSPDQLGSLIRTGSATGGRSVFPRLSREVP